MVLCPRPVFVWLTAFLEVLFFRAYVLFAWFLPPQYRGSCFLLSVMSCVRSWLLRPSSSFWILHLILASIHPPKLDDVWLHHTLLGVLLHQLHPQGVGAEVSHGLPERRIQEHLAHHMTLQNGGVTQQVAQELLPSQSQVFTKHVNVQVIPRNLTKSEWDGTEEKRLSVLLSSIWKTKEKLYNIPNTSMSLWTIKKQQWRIQKGEEEVRH